jgi:Ni,Fe-hydrogenase III small subunit/sulfur relay (sulfurtransferase) DsrF/TusC family protein
MVSVYYDDDYSGYISNMSEENNFLVFKPLTWINEINDEDIFILNSDKIYNIKSNNIIKIDHKIQNIYHIDTVSLPYDLKTVYIYYYQIFIKYPNNREFIISYNIYNKILHLVNQEKYPIAYPIIFDAIETYLHIAFTNKSFFRIGDGEQKVPNGHFDDIISKEQYENTLKVLDKNYKYDNNKLFVCYNEIYYDGFKMIATKRSPEYWTPAKKFFSLQLNYQNKKNIYYSSHCFRIYPKLKNMYSRFSRKNITMFLSRIFKHKDIIVIDSSLELDPFYDYNSRIDICYGSNPNYPNAYCISQEVTDFVLSKLKDIFTQNPDKEYVIFVKGTCLSNLITNLYYMKYRICDVGSFHLSLDNIESYTQPKPTEVYYKDE